MASREVKVKIFISWSGERSEALARALHKWFPAVLQFVEPWLSQSDIQSGKRWSVEVAKELENCNYGILCVTRENLASPWILFEAGALAKSMQDGRVVPLLLNLDFKEISGPLAQFQAKKADSEGIRELLLDLNKASSAPVPDSTLETLLQAVLGKLEEELAAIPKNSATVKHKRPEGEILEELVSSVRSVEMRVRDVMDDEPFFRRRRRSRIHPMMMHELIHRTSDGPNDPVQLLYVGSLLRDDAPWLYELALEAYRTLRSGSIGDGQRSVRRFLESFEMLQKGEFSEEFGIDRMTLKMIRSEFLHSFDFLRFDSLSEPLNDSKNQGRAQAKKKE
jgi:TIR domain